MRCDELVGDLFPHLSALLLERVFFECGVIRLMARTRVAEVACPGCAVMSKGVHSTYGRCLADTPVGDRPVLIELTVRRPYCENVRCSRRTFAEQVEGLTVRYGRRTPAARRVLEAVAVALMRPGREPTRCCSARSGEPDDTITDGDGPTRSGLDRSEGAGRRRLRHPRRTALRHCLHRLRDRSASGPVARP